MDRREAIEWLKSIRRTLIFEQVEALDLAIEALMLQDKYIKAVGRMIEGAKEIKIFLERMTCDYNAIDAESATTTDCISRADLIESFLADNECKREEAKACMCNLDLMLELIEDAPSITPTEGTREGKEV